MQQVQASRPTDKVPALLTVKEVAAALRVDPSTVYRACERGEIATVRLSPRPGSLVRIPASELGRLLALRPLLTPAQGGRP